MWPDQSARAAMEPGSDRLQAVLLCLEPQDRLLLQEANSSRGGGACTWHQGGVGSSCLE
jgi:hypothetical protein